MLVDDFLNIEGSSSMKLLVDLVVMVGVLSRVIRFVRYLENYGVLLCG